ncbi:uncharacterized protein V1518DRAFT_422664 [Limtongia smithiae]|uniref:uncharacterized protein n=1 Tax=Limtongia smithiae TaxID=1125753 RepID=UPI0034D01A45
MQLLLSTANPTGIASLLGRAITVASEEAVDLRALAPLQEHGLQTAEFGNADGDTTHAGAVKMYGASTLYVIYYTAGLALCFERSKGDQFELEALELYSSDAQYRAVEASLLPIEGLSITTTGKELVQAFGEPDDKGGGMREGIDIWFRWDTVGHGAGLEVQMDSRSWEDGQRCAWRSIIYFKSSEQ